MVKKLMMVLILTVPCVYADWLDEFAQLTEDTQKLDLHRAGVIIQKLINAEKRQIEELEKTIAERKERGFWATVRGGTYQVQLTAAKQSLHYYQKVAQFLKELPNSKRERAKFTEQLTGLQKLYQDLAQLKEDFSHADGYGQKIKVGALIAAKELHIRSSKTLIKSAFLL